MSAGSRAINYIFIAFSGILGFAVGLIIYRRTMARAAELAEEEAEEIGAAAGPGSTGYADALVGAGSAYAGYGYYGPGRGSSRHGR